MPRRRLLVVLVVLAVAASALSACRPARVGARCSTTELGRDATHVLRCVGGRWRRLITIQQAAALLLRPAVGEVVRPTSLPDPQLPNTADPSVLVDGSTTYVYATTTWLNVPVVALDDLSVVHTQNEMFGLATEAMPNPPAWAASRAIWAPTVARLGGRYVMYFAAQRRNPPSPSDAQCVGRAFADSPLGPFVPDAIAMTCGNDGVHGALDPDVFVAPDGTAYLLVAMNARNDNLWSFRLDAGGGFAGPPSKLLTREQPWQEFFLENPSMYFDGSTYLLTYSNGNWKLPSYNTGVARCSSPTGPCTDRADGPWIASLGDRSGPGGLDVFVGTDGAPRVAYHSYRTGDVGEIGKRSTTIQRFATDPWPRLG